VSPSPVRPSPPKSSGFLFPRAGVPARSSARPQIRCLLLEFAVSVAALAHVGSVVFFVLVASTSARLLSPSFLFLPYRRSAPPDSSHSHSSACSDFLVPIRINCAGKVCFVLLFLSRATVSFVGVQLVDSLSDFLLAPSQWGSQPGRSQRATSTFGSFSFLLADGMQKPPPDRFLFAVKDLSLLCVDYLQVVVSVMLELPD
jgi:hypothetical protein